MTLEMIILLIVSGIVVGFINTLAGGGAIMSMTVFMALGLPIGVANGTNRIAVVLQNLTSSAVFIKKRLLDIKSGLKLSVPAIIGNIAGSMVATQINETVFKICMGVVLFAILAYMLFAKTHIHGGHGLKIKWWHYLWFLLIGFYGGYVYIGLGYLILAITLTTMHLDIITANVIKGFVIFVATPFSLIVFMLHGQVDYGVGLLHALGNIIGTYVASHYGIHWGTKFLKYFMIAVVLVSIADLFGWISLHDICVSLIH